MCCPKNSKALAVPAGSQLPARRVPGESGRALPHYADGDFDLSVPEYAVATN